MLSAEKTPEASNTGGVFAARVQQQQQRDRLELMVRFSTVAAGLLQFSDQTVLSTAE